VGNANKRFFEKMLAYPKGWRVLGYLVDASLWGVKVTDSEIGRDGFISDQSRLAAGGSRAVRLGYCSKSEVQQVNETPRKALGASTACIQVLLVDRLLAELAMVALRVIIFFEKMPACLKRLAGFRESWLCFTIGIEGSS